MKRNRFIIVGIGNIGRDLLEKLPKELDLLCIENAPDAEERAKKIRGENVTVLRGDATSRLTLEQAGIDDAEGVLISTTSETVNLEVARLLKEHFHPKRVIAVGITTDGIRKLAELGAEVQEMFATSAAGIRNLLEQRTRSAASIGLGKNEILEVELHPNSRLANKRLRGLAPLRWRIGIIYRDGNIIIPRGDTVLKPKDRIVILGDPSVLKTVTEIMTFNFERFPLEYGSTAMAYLEGDEGDEFFAELSYLVDIFPFQRIVLVYTGRAAGRASEYDRLIDRTRFRNLEERTVDLPLDAAIRKVNAESGMECGMVILSKNILKRGLWPSARKRLFLDICVQTACPVLICQGTHPYEKSVIAAVEGLSPHHALETALEVGSSLDNEVTALLVQPAPYIASDGDFKEFESMRKTVSELGLIYRMSVQMPVLKGNPVHAVVKSLTGYNLLFIDTGNLRKQRWPVGLLNPDVVWHILVKSPISTLLIPPVEESL